MSNKKYFIKQLLQWNKKDNKRIMPWKGEKDPYKIWLSEIILQQTRVEQGWAYYNRFVSAFPNVKKLAKAADEKVFKLWEGLGYYTRCKNLIATAKFIANEKQGKFPDTYEEIQNLKGIGPYTAAAISSFAFNLPCAVVDGNVFRVLSRFFGIDTPIDSTVGKKLFTDLAEEILDKKQPGIYNQAIMDFGAIVCKPQNPLCSTCPLKTQCAALLQGKAHVLPVKTGKIIKKQRWFYYLVISYNGKIYVRKRGPKEIWENLYEFVLLETDKQVSFEEIKRSEFLKNVTATSKSEILHVSKTYKQQLTHQTLQGSFIQIKLKTEPILKEYKAVTYKELKRLAFPRFITAYLAENELKAFER
ncbi:MAG: A/G-specific adenine glycosylase [Ferruginibacter sp.]|nr:A/G-specific adenine glycosylase [Ferruginibacter sp.]